MKYIPYGKQWIDKKDVKEAVKVLKSDWITQGPTIKRFEESLCEYTSAKYAVAVANGTAALHIACLAAEIEKGDEVITSPLTFLASANCILYSGGKPVFCDIEPDTANINTNEIKRKISKRTKALIPVHYAGHPCDMKEISSIAEKKGLLIIEDAAHALGASYKGTKVGSCRYSDMSILSFHPVKHITTGEGGAVLTNNKSLYEKLIKYRNHGITQSGFLNRPHGKWYYEMQVLGFNYRITDIQAALGISQMKKLNNFVKKRRSIAAFYNKAFKNNDFFDTPVEKAYGLSSYHLYPIRLKDNMARRKEDIFSSLRINGLGVQVHYIPVYLQPYYRKLGYKTGICPESEKFYRSEISLPMFPLLSRKDMETVVKKLIKTIYSYC